MSAQNCSFPGVERIDGTDARICGLKGLFNSTPSAVMKDCCGTGSIISGYCSFYCNSNTTLHDFWNCINTGTQNASEIAHSSLFCQGAPVKAQKAKSPSSASHINSPSWATLTLAILLFLPTLFGTATAAANCTEFHLEQSYTTIAGHVRCGANQQQLSGPSIMFNGSAFVESNGTIFTPTPSFDTITALKVISSAVPNITFLNEATNYTMNEEIELAEGTHVGFMIFTPYLRCVSGTWSGCSDASENGKSVKACTLMEINGGSDVRGSFSYIST